jgi:hypothetical protein
VAGALAALAGAAAAAVAALALPWARYRVQAQVAGSAAPVDATPDAWIFQTGRLLYATGYVFLLAVTIALAATAGLGESRNRARPGALALASGVVTALLGWLILQHVGSTTGNAEAAGFAAVQVQASVAAGAVFGVLAPPLVGFTGALLGAARPRWTAVAAGASGGDPARRLT